MFRSRWFHNLFHLARPRPDRRRQAAWQRRRVRPMLKALEDRLTPSTVTESAATGVDLQTDLNNATATNTNYVINLTGVSSAYNLTAELTVSAAASGSSVNIVGTGQSITGAGNDRVFQVNGGCQRHPSKLDDHRGRRHKNQQRRPGRRHRRPGRRRLSQQGDR